MKKDFTRIVMILDRSGSMRSVRDATISGFNEYIASQKKLPGHVQIRLIQFDDHYEQVFDLPLSLVPELNRDAFVPRGMTALLDAQGRGITELGSELAALSECERPSNVIVITLTDGLENASRHYVGPRNDTGKVVRDLIKHQTDTYNWHFVYIGANQDAIAVAQDLGIAFQNALTYTASAQGMGNTMDAASNYTRGIRMCGQAMFSDEDRKSALAR